jgi:hypothetical protein
VDKFPKADLNFVTFSKEPSFERTGTLYLYSSPERLLYRIDGTNVLETGAVYREEWGAWELRTRSLGAYILSDVPLLENRSGAPAKPDAPAGKPNPATGRASRQR